MRLPSVLKKLFVLAALLMTLFKFCSAESHTSSTQYPAQPPARMPSAMLECEGDQCTRGGGGALWVFDGMRGEAKWHYGAVADLTVEQFDGRSIVLSRADPPGTYSSRWAGRDGYFRARYTGTLRANRIDGSVYFNGDTSHPGTWFAIVSESPCNPGTPCPLGMDQIRELGARAQNARLSQAYALCTRIANAQDAADRPMGGTGVLPADPGGICRSKQIREAMQAVEDLAVHDPNGAALSLLACGITGVCGQNGRPTILQSRPASDGGRYTAHDPGSFICQGLFARGDVHLTVQKDGDLESELTKEEMDRLLQQFPNFEEAFKVRPLQNGNFLLILVPISVPLSREYHQEFAYP